MENIFIKHSVEKRCNETSPYVADSLFAHGLFWISSDLNWKLMDIFLYNLKDRWNLLNISHWVKIILVRQRNVEAFIQVRPSCGYFHFNVQVFNEIGEAKKF